MISGVILAAGSSTRMQHTKPLLPIGEKPMLQHVVDVAFQAALDEILVVVGHDADRVRDGVKLPPNARFVLNLDYKAGMSTSLIAGLEAADPTAEAVVVLMGDQPRLSPAVVRTLITKYGETRMPVVRAMFRDAPGPALLAVGIWEDLMSIKGDIGARAFIDENSDLVEEVGFDREAPTDVDTEEDYRRVLEESAHPREDEA